jgi:fibronectin type 3 domain-containing protein
MAELALSDARTYTDVTAEFGKSYRYRVQEVAEAGTPPAVSELTEETAITPQDTFAPAAPTGLAAVVGTKSVELVWDRNSEPDVTGYRVYRAMEDGKPEVIGGEVPALAFSDTRIEAGKRYRYAVSALKKNGKESKLSEAIGITIP